MIFAVTAGAVAVLGLSGDDESAGPILGATVHTFHTVEHDARLYTIFVPTTPDRVDEANAAFDELVASWSWG